MRNVYPGAGEAHDPCAPGCGQTWSLIEGHPVLPPLALRRVRRVKAGTSRASAVAELAVLPVGV